MNLESEKESCVFVGNSPNDAPMFELFPHSIGGANISTFIDRLDVSARITTTKMANKNITHPG